MLSALALRGHWVHVVVFGIPVAGLVGAVAAQEIRARWGQRATAEPGIDGLSPHLRVAVAGLLAAAAIHVVVIPEHFREYVLFGLFFSALAVAQLLLALLLTYRPNHQLVRWIALASAWVIVLWVASRTTGIPFGPESWQPERLGSLDAAATTAELITLVGCLSQLWASPIAVDRSDQKVQELSR
jgi:hypothetical protein